MYFKYGLQANNPGRNQVKLDQELSNHPFKMNTVLVKINNNICFWMIRISVKHNNRRKTYFCIHQASDKFSITYTLFTKNCRYKDK